MSPVPAVSVLMPVFNAERYVAEAVESILAQTFADFEFIVVDDGSTDRSAEIVERYAARDPRIRLIRALRAGLVPALIRGVQECRGEFIARMDADDISLPQRLERHLDHLRRDPSCVAVGCDQLVIDADGAPIFVHSYAADHESIHREHLSGVPGAMPHACVLRHSAVRAVGGYPADLEVFEDFWLFMRLAEHGRLANLPEVLHLYRQHHSNVHFTQFELQQRCIDRIVAEARERNGLPPLGAPVWSDYSLPTKVERHRRWALLAASAGFRITALRHAVTSIRMAPLSPRSWYVLCRTLTPSTLVAHLKALAKRVAQARAGTAAR